MLELAQRLTEATGAPARWILSDVLDTPAELDGTADLVYTGRGSLIWLQDLDAWAAVIARLLSPTGRFVLFEGHPAEWLFDVDEDGRWIATDYDYFGGAEASKGWAPEYIDRLSIPEDDQHWKFARAWTLGEVITALLRGRAAARRGGRAPDRLVGRPRRRPTRGSRPDPAVVLRGRRQARLRRLRSPLDGSGRRQPDEPAFGASIHAVDRSDRPTLDGTVDVRVRRTRDVEPPRDVERVEVDRQRQERPRIGAVVAVEGRARVPRRRRCSG